MQHVLEHDRVEELDVQEKERGRTHPSRLERIRFVATAVVSMITALLAYDGTVQAEDVKPDKKPVPRDVAKAAAEHRLLAEKWLNSKDGLPSILNDIERALKDMNDREWTVREAGSEEMVRILTSLKQMLDPLPLPEEINLMTNPERPGITLEQKHRLITAHRETMLRNDSAPIRLPPMNASAFNIIEELNKRGVLDITIESELVEQLKEIQMKVDVKTNGAAELIKEICDKADAYVIFGDIGSLTIAPKEHKNIEMIATPILLGSIQRMKLLRERDGVMHVEETDVLQIRLPGKGIITTFKPTHMSGKWEVHEPDTLRVDGSIPVQLNAHEMKTKWKHTSGGQDPIRKRTVKPTIIGQHAEQDRPRNLNLKTVTAHGFRKVSPKITKFLPEDNAPGEQEAKEEGLKIGFQEFKVEKAIDPGDGMWKAMVTIDIYKDVEWPVTKHKWDTLGYSAAESNQYTFFNSDGRPITAKMTSLTIRQRVMECVFTMTDVGDIDTEPQKVEIVAPTTLKKTEMQLPLPNMNREKKAE